MSVTFLTPNIGHLDHPLMPKGVEHFPAASCSIATFAVDHPLMPKGVEHILDQGTGAHRAIDHPLMPKGVEHSFAELRQTVLQASIIL